MLLHRLDLTSKRAISLTTHQLQLSLPRVTLDVHQFDIRCCISALLGSLSHHDLLDQAMFVRIDWVQTINDVACLAVCGAVAQGASRVQILNGTLGELRL